MKKYIKDFTILRNTKLNSNHNLLELKVSDKLPEMHPGQFVEVRVDKSETTYLRRPFSIHRVNLKENTIHLLIKKVGDGTKALANASPGENINIIGPLGKGFHLTENKDILLVGGGCGIAPLYFLAEQLHSKGNRIKILIGGRSEEDILMADDYKTFGDVLIATEDGSLGEKGMVTAHSIIKGNDHLSQNKMDDNIDIKFDKIYCCGPDGMMRAIAHHAENLNIPCEVSLENTMACGFGACLCCVVESTTGNVTVCTEGPVFDSKNLKGWTNKTEVSCSLD